MSKTISSLEICICYLLLAQVVMGFGSTDLFSRLS